MNNDLKYFPYSNQNHLNKPNKLLKPSIHSNQNNASPKFPITDQKAYLYKPKEMHTVVNHSPLLTAPPQHLFQYASKTLPFPLVFTHRDIIIYAQF